MQFSVTLDAPAPQWPAHYSTALKLAAGLALEGVFHTNVERLKRRCEEARNDAVQQLERDVRDMMARIDVEVPPVAQAPVEAPDEQAARRKVVTRRAGAYSLPQLVEHILTMPEPFTVRRLFESAPAGVGTMLFFSQLCSQLLATGFLYKTGTSTGPGKRKVMLLKRTGKPYPYTRS